MGRVAATESGTRSRTRRAILSAAASVLARNRAATLTDIADAATIARSTLHRYFSDRDELIKAAVEDSLQAIGESTAEAAIDQGTPQAAMRRLIAAMVAVGDRLMFLFGDPRVLEEHGPHPPADAGDRPEQPTIDLIERGQAEGAFDPEVSPDWILNVLYALVYTGIEMVDKGLLPRHGVTTTVIRTFENGVGARDR